MFMCFQIFYLSVLFIIINKLNLKNCEILYIDVLYIIRYQKQNLCCV